jgi:thiol-disulfide isomerase/thioredoxin
MKSVLLTMPLLAALCVTAVCAAPQAVQIQKPAEEPQAQAPIKKEEPVLVGPATREQIEASPEWVQAEVAAQPDAEAAKALAAVEPGAEVTVFLGTWCGDSRREVPRLWKALDEAGGDVPFKLRYVAVDRQKKEPAGPIADSGIHFVPTFIVSRGGHEVGRVVEESPKGIERDLLDLLTGKAQGVIATREDLTSKGAPKPPL